MSKVNPEPQNSNNIAPNLVRYSQHGTISNNSLRQGVVMLSEFPFVSSNRANEIGVSLDNSFGWSLVANILDQGLHAKVLDQNFASGLARTQGTPADALVCQRLATEHTCQPDLVRKLYDIAVTNQIVSGVIQVDDGSETVVPYRYGLYYQLSRVNHSCDPNSEIKITPTGAQLVSLRPIQDGEEVTYSYTPTPTRENLLQQYGFTCTCQVCVKSCPVCGAVATSRCTNCPSKIKYCSVPCQRLHWKKEHKHIHPKKK